MVSRYLQVSAIVILSFFLSTCKKDEGGEDNENLFEVFQTLNNTRDKFFENGQATNGNYKEAIMLTGAWVETQPGVKSAFYEDSSNIFITMESGLKTMLNVYETDAQGHTKYRGGGGGGTFKRIDLKGDCANNIKNKKVLLFAAAYDDFYRNDPNALQRVVDLFEDAHDDFEVTVLKDAQCTPDLVETFGDYGFVSLETHGGPESFMSGVKLTVDDPPSITNNEQLIAYITSKLGSQYGQWFAEGKVVLGEKYELDPVDVNWWQSGIAGTFLEREYSVSISSVYIKSLPPTPNTVILGNMCYSGYGALGSCRNPGKLYLDNPIRKAFESLNPISYYCYAFSNEVSTTVFDSEAKVMLWELTQSLLEDGDSTGNCHLTNIGSFREATVGSPILTTQCQSPFFFKHFGKTDYCYSPCGDTLIDTRADTVKYPTVCIGEQVWMAKNVAYDNGSSSCTNISCTYGSIDAFYDLDLENSRIGSCPPGWHVPSKAEWETLFTEVGGMGQAGSKLKSTTFGGTDEYDFNVLAGGTAEEINSFLTPAEIGSAIEFWTSDEVDPNDPLNQDAYAVRFTSSGAVSIVVRDGAFRWAHCRCLKD